MSRREFVASRDDPLSWVGRANKADLLRAVDKYRDAAWALTDALREIETLAAIGMASSTEADALDKIVDVLQRARTKHGTPPRPSEYLLPVRAVK